jgi:membrane protein required for beta-lactamase induction
MFLTAAGLWSLPGIIWLACVIVVIVDANRRHMSPIFWPLVTLFSGPLGLVAYGIVRELSGKKETD